jgi:class 3 adenylate cyclase
VSSNASVRTFLIADIRGYSRFTEEYGDEAAVRLAAKFKDIVEEIVETRNGRVVEIRGDEALTVFESARQSIRAAMDLQRSFAEETNADVDLPLRVGIGIDSGEAVEVGDGSFRGSSLNVASRLCALAHGEEVLVSESTSRLAGRLPGLRYVDRGRMTLKGVGSIHAFRVAGEDEKVERNWVVFLLGGQRRQIGWKPILAVIAVAAATAASVVYLTTRGDASSASEPGSLTTGGTPTGSGGVSTTTPTNSGGELTLADLVPAKLWSGCQEQAVPDPNAVETAVCPAQADVQGFQPDRWQISLYPNGRELRRAYERLRETHNVAKDQGRCSRFSWTGEHPWEHGPDQPGGRKLCYFEGDDAVIVWTHERLAQETHRDVLMIAREGGSDHARLQVWWRPWHHLIGKAE